MSDSSLESVWYASYGSNCDSARFALYLDGGRGDGPRGAHRGARDPSPPRESAPMDFDSQVTYVGRSRRWAGGVAFLEHRPAGRGVPGALGRRYLITWGQFEDVVAQENNRPTRPLRLDLAVAGDSQIMGEGRYDRALCLGHVDGVPLITFTSPIPPEMVEPTPPSPNYLSTVAAGLKQIHDLTPVQIVDRLRISEVVAVEWTAAELLELVH